MTMLLNQGASFAEATAAISTHHTDRDTRRAVIPDCISSLTSVDLPRLSYPSQAEVCLHELMSCLVAWRVVWIVQAGTRTIVFDDPVATVLALQQAFSVVETLLRSSVAM